MKKKIAVVGGGLTGLVIAYRLGQRGYRVSLFEKADKLGGLLSSFKLEKTYLEKTYHHIFKTDKEIINLIKELELENKLVWKDSSIGLYLNKKTYAFVSAIDLLKFEALPLIDRLRMGMVGLYLQKTTNWKKFEGVSADQWMKKMCGKKAYESVWKPLLIGKFHHFYKDVSMAWLWARIHIRGKSSNAFGKEKLGYLEGGFQLITNKLIKRIDDDGGKIFCKSEVDKIIDNKIWIKGKSRKFEKIICCIDSNNFAKLIEDNKKINKKYLKKLKSIEYLGALNLVFTTKQNLSNYYWHNINDSESPFLAFIQHTNLIDKKMYGNRHVYYMGTYLSADNNMWKMEDEKIYSLFLAYLKKIFPAFEAKKIEKKYLFRLEKAQHLVNCDYEKKIPAYKTQLDNVFLFNFSQIYPEDRGLNYAVKEGNKAIEVLE
ncbi:NAD(P)/FAD-dependent oxidoreductase [Patescibacteria group bacterium]|nr:NAD(P)/FAD-dependent oxidoreductase [Patescibacteria group bacterium]MCG2702457.1 NAD(P)/FAD-dependent oxidoreductase [Candidatus Parcubacteria bacterium]MBU4264493.1 NAD(P)/FAD-dependent oxidoreductase [Patescibacteria group bacterium]MBU4390424.1 NAD(P)/FAD-dependent oxidoreductase [Patescibacteria group bacterium]MBU4396719.1 NAD(P)/FAD-dependent oxidoreductase [Patescibacteria group bacterium]